MAVNRRERLRAVSMDEWVAEFFRRTVLRMQLAEIMTIFRTWGFFTEKELNTLNIHPPKENIANEVIQLCEKKQATMRHAAALEIVYNHANPNKRLWNVYQMSKPTDSEMELFDVSEFKLQFKKNILSVSKNVNIHFKEYGEEIWIRIAWGTQHAKPNQYKATFVVYHSQTPYCFITNLIKTNQPVLCQAFIMAARYGQIQEMELKSRSLDSLKDIVFKRCNQPFQTYHPRPLQERNINPGIVDQRVTYENMREKERIHHATREAFGDGPQPKLEFASYKLDTMFRVENNNGILAGREEPFRCVVKFSSPHLLEALKSLAPAGLAEAPMSNLLTCIPHKARNIFKITEKRGLHPASSQAPNM
ncbi:centromere protein N isoform 1-T2 [Discoglossus pictus]